MKGPVMVVDGDALSRRSLVAVLEAAGYRTEGAADGPEALAHLRAGLAPRLVLLDTGVAGRQLPRALAAADIPVLAVSQPGRGSRGLHPAGRLTRPLDLDAVLDAVRPATA